MRFRSGHSAMVMASVSEPRPGGSRVVGGIAMFQQLRSDSGLAPRLLAVTAHQDVTPFTDKVGSLVLDKPDSPIRRAVPTTG